MKRTLIALMALSMLSVGVAQAAEKRPISNFLNKLEAAEEQTYKKLEANKKEAEMRQKQREEAKAQREEQWKKQQEEEARAKAMEIETRYKEYRQYVHEGDSLTVLGNSSGGDDYEQFYLSAVGRYDAFLVFLALIAEQAFGRSRDYAHLYAITPQQGCACNKC